VSGLGYGTGGAIERDGTGGAIERDGTGGGAAGEVDAGLRSALALGALCNDAVVRLDATGAPEMVGDPTEAALVVLAAKAGIDVDGLRARLQRLAEVPFDSATKYMATLHEHPDDPNAAVVVVKGAPDVVLGMCTAVSGPDGPLSLDDEARRLVEAENVGLGGEGLRVLAVASRRLPVRAVEFEGDLDAEVAELTLDALVGILDPARPEAVAAIAECHHAGIGVRMITGDHAATAGAIAAELGIVGEVVTGSQLDAMTDDELAARIEGIGVCARVSPEHKVRVVRALQANGEVVAMTGDGVNDAPALKQAEIGVAMGITGTEVTKEAGDMVLADDNFATIVAAVERGRAIYENILSFVRFQLTTNVAAIGSFLGALLLGLPAPFNPIQVLFVNIIADGPPAMSLGVDPPRPGAMSRPPRPVHEQILSGERLFRILLSAAIMVVITLGLFWVAEDRLAEDVALTMTFTTFVLLQMANALAVRVGSDSVFSRHSLSNKVLWLALAGVIAIQVLVVQVPFLQGVFDTVGLTPSQWGICAAGAVGFLVVDEVRSFGQRAISRRRGPRSASVPSPA
jgi:Ca2+-transporting ATPase